MIFLIIVTIIDYLLENKGLELRNQVIQDIRFLFSIPLVY